MFFLWRKLCVILLLAVARAKLSRLLRRSTIPLPTPAQAKWQADEIMALCHFVSRQLLLREVTNHKLPHRHHRPCLQNMATFFHNGDLLSLSHNCTNVLLLLLCVCVYVCCVCAVCAAVCAAVCVLHQQPAFGAP